MTFLRLRVVLDLWEVYSESVPRMSWSPPQAVTHSSLASTVAGVSWSPSQAVTYTAPWPALYQGCPGPLPRQHHTRAPDQRWHTRPDPGLHSQTPRACRCGSLDSNHHMLILHPSQDLGSLREPSNESSSSSRP